jgi:membrane protease YdiL (CAAX protease family)
MPFTLRLAITIAAAALVAAAIAPLVAVAVGSAGYHFPFPRIFDRTVMIAVAALLSLQARKLRLVRLLQRGFAHPTEHGGAAVRGLLIAIIAVAILLALGAASGARVESRFTDALARVPKFIASAIVIAIIEEAFFRAILLGGMVDDLGASGALVASSAVYALAHLVRSPARFELVHLELSAGLHNLSASMARLLHPGSATPALVGLFLLGLVLGKAFLATGTIYFSAALHAGLVIGVKLWPYSAAPAIAPPHWIAGYGRPALIGGPAAWIIALIILVLLPRLVARRT